MPLPFTYLCSSSEESYEVTLRERRKKIKRIEDQSIGFEFFVDFCESLTETMVLKSMGFQEKMSNI